MNIILYNTNSDTRRLNKTLTQISTIPFRLKDDTDMARPVIELDSANLPPTANYAYIADLGRYYYINGQRILPGNQLELTLKSDVLMSFKDIILNSVVVARRSSNNYNKMLPDMIPLQANRNLLYRKFEGGNAGFGSNTVTENSKCYCLTVLNGGVQLNPPAGLTLELQYTLGVKYIYAKWDNVTGARFYNVDVRLSNSEWQTAGVALTATELLIPPPGNGMCEVRVAPVDNTGNLIGAYATANIDVGG